MSQHEPTEEEEPEIQLADPDDYHRRQRLKEIHKARQRVHKVIEQVERTNKRKVDRHQRRELAYGVSMYVSELEPMIDDIDADVTLPDHWPYDTIIEFADHLGSVPSEFEHEKLPSDMRYTPRQNSIEVFRKCNEILSEVKPLITENENNEWEV